MDYLLKASTVIVLFYLCYGIFLKKETFFQHNRWFLMIGLCVAFIFPTIVIPIEILVEPINTQEISFYSPETVNITPSIEENSTDWRQWISIAYVLGFMVFMIQFLLQFGSLAYLLIKHPKSKEGIYTYIIVKSKISPFSFFKWIVYNPDIFEDHELQLILNHEKVHVRQIHSLDIIIGRLACVVFWFNPFVWLYRKDIQQNLEYIADHNTQITTKKTIDYQKLLVKTTIADHNLSVSTNFYNSLIKKRIIMLNKSRSHQKNLWKLLFVVPFLAVLLLSTNRKEVYVEKPDTDTITISGNIEHYENNDTLNESANKEETIEYIFTKDLSDTQLEKIKSELKDKGVIMTIETLDRNDEGTITNIRLSFETELSSANYGVSDSGGIKPFVFRMNDMGGIKVGTLDEKNTFVIKDKGESKNTFIYRSDTKNNDNGEDGNIHIIEDNDDDQIIYLNGNAKIRTTGNGSYAYIIADSVNMKNQINGAKWVIRDGKKDLNSIENDHVNIITRSSDSEPIFIVNGKKVTRAEVYELNPKVIDSMRVLKGTNATSIYGTAGENGVIVISADSIKNYNLNSTSPWKVRTGVSSLEFFDDKDPSKNGISYHVTKLTSDREFETFKNQLKERGIDAKFSKIKRNLDGEITSIKISLSDDQGAKASATWRDDEITIPKILVGKIRGKLRVSSSSF